MPPPKALCLVLRRRGRDLTCRGVPQRGPLGEGERGGALAVGTEHRSGTEARASPAWAGHDRQTRAGSSTRRLRPRPPLSHPRHRHHVPPPPPAPVLPPPRGPATPLRHRVPSTGHRRQPSRRSPCPAQAAHRRLPGTSVPPSSHPVPPSSHPAPPQLTPSAPKGSAPLSPIPCCSASAAQPALGTPGLSPASLCGAAAQRWQQRRWPLAGRGSREVSARQQVPWAGQGRNAASALAGGGHKHPRGPPVRHGPPARLSLGAAAGLAEPREALGRGGASRHTKQGGHLGGLVAPHPQRLGWGTGTAVTPAGQRDPCPGAGAAGGHLLGLGGVGWGAAAGPLCRGGGAAARAHAEAHCAARRGEARLGAAPAPSAPPPPLAFVCDADDPHTPPARDPPPGPFGTQTRWQPVSRSGAALPRCWGSHRPPPPPRPRWGYGGLGRGLGGVSGDSWVLGRGQDGAWRAMGALGVWRVSWEG